MWLDWFGWFSGGVYVRVWAFFGVGGVILGFLGWFLRLRFGFAGFGALLVYLDILWC